jgi:serine/threonine protein kinase/dienelactone hydrolase
MDPLDAAVSQLFEKALDLDRQQRTAFLDSACLNQPGLRRQVEALLEENDRLTGFLRTPAWQPRDGNRAALETNPPHDAHVKVETLQGSDVGLRLGRYLLLEQLGAGGMGVVYRARDEKLERMVAVKILNRGLLSSEALRAHFRREALALARLNHPGIAALYDVGEQDGTDYIVMEWVQGESLHAKLQSGPLALADALRILVQIAEALEEAHAHGVIHRDLKPANVVITLKGHAKVLDFGVAKLLTTSEITQSVMDTGTLIGTPLYMSPEQAMGRKVDARTDLWSLGAMGYEMLTGQPPFHGENAVAVLHVVVSGRPGSTRQSAASLPAPCEKLIHKALEKDPEKRYASAADMLREAKSVLDSVTRPPDRAERRSTRWLRTIAVSLTLVLIVAIAAGWFLYRRMAERRWAREEAIPQIESLIEGRQAIPAWALLQRAQSILPGDPHLRQIADSNSEIISVNSDPPGATVSIQDYLSPKSEPLNLGTTPLQNIRIPRGYFRWTLRKPGSGTILVAPETSSHMDFSLARQQQAPPGMVYAAGGPWASFNGFIGWMGPYTFPAYYMDRYEVTNRDYQKFVDSGGYQNPKFWPAVFQKDGRSLSWAQAMQFFRDATGRPGPSTWTAGHYPEGKADFPVSGVSWYEAQAYAQFAGKTLPVIGQWYQAADFDVTPYTVQLSNLRGDAPSAAGSFQGIGPYGTYDLAGNVREWMANEAEGGLHFILGGSWRSPMYLYSSPEALSPFDRSDTDGFRCVRNLGSLPPASTQPVHRVTRDFAKYKPVSDDVFRAYTLLYAYSPTPLNAKSEGIVKETANWREEKVTFDAAYNGERMAAYLFLPKRVKPPYQTVLLFPSARVLFLPPDSSELGDVQYFDYIVESGRAVLYPVYEDTYERRLAHKLPGDPDEINEPVQWYKDAARSLDYLATRPDIDTTRMAYLGVSMGSADGVIFSTLLQDRLKTAVFLDGGFFMANPRPGIDQADFAPRMKKPVLMVNGRYDYTFPVVNSQDPLFRLLGTPAADKSHVVLDTPHDVTEQRPLLVKTVLDWLDHYLGPVQGL